MQDKIGIVTLFGLYNYGNRLQNYAVQEILEKCSGCQCETLVSYEYEPKAHIKFWIKAILRRDARAFAFRRFNKKYIHIRELKEHSLLFPERIADEYKYFAVGSDQVWNPLIRQNQRSNFFLQFARKAQRLSVAPSIAVDDIPEQYIECYREGLEGFNHISVREQKSADVVKKITGREATVLIDPTMALPMEKWTKMERKARVPHNDYMCILFLGDVDEERKNSLEQIAAQYSLTIVDMNSKEWCALPPDQFLYVIHNAKIICTDSFHCTVFSILYHRPFIVFQREAIHDGDVSANAGDRLTTLLNTFGLADRLCTNVVSGKEFDIDYSYVDVQLKKERQKFYSFMEKQLNREV